jgi:uncharacterized membrane protein YphA (DoxX/SURF4 family)
MAFDRQGTGWVVLRIALGVFFIMQAITKLGWIMDSGILRGQFDLWMQNADRGSISALYLQRIAMPGIPIFARLVPVGEFICGVALLVGFWTPVFAFLAFFMVLNYQLASGALTQLSYLANRSGLPVLAATLALALGGVRLPWSIRS